MNSQKSFVEIRESLKSLVEPKHIIFNPSHSWMVEVLNSNGEIIGQNKITTLYCIIGKIYDFLVYSSNETGELPNFLYTLFEECISTGFSDLQQHPVFLDPRPENDTVYWTINYQGKPRLNDDNIQDGSITAQSLALESISMIIELAKRNEVSELHDIKENLYLR